MHKAKSYVDNWEEMKRNHIGCLFWGPVGTGKSYIAGCIANELLKREVTVKMTNFNTIIDNIFPLADKTEYINALASYQPATSTTGSWAASVLSNFCITSSILSCSVRTAEGCIQTLKKATSDNPDNTNTIKEKLNEGN